MCTYWNIGDSLTNYSVGRTEAAIALRLRLNETVDQLDALQRQHAELEVNFEQISRELTIAKSDCMFFVLDINFSNTIQCSEPCQQRSVGDSR